VDVFVSRCALCHAGESTVQKASAFAAFAAAALLQASPASAGVILEQPQIKKVGACTTGQSGQFPRSSFDLIWQQQLKILAADSSCGVAGSSRARLAPRCMPSSASTSNWTLPLACTGKQQQQ
jgi:hypothetical protein